MKSNPRQGRSRLLNVWMVCAAALSALPFAARGQSQPSRETASQLVQQTVIRGGWLFTGVADTRVRNSGIVIADGKFIEVGANLNGRDLSKARIIDLDDAATILPGMFDLHAHYNMRLLD